MKNENTLENTLTLNPPTTIFAPSIKKGYSLRIGENLYNRVNKHLQLLKHFDNHSNSKQRWLVEAIKEKLEAEQHQGLEGIPKERHIGIRIDQNLSEKIESRVNLIRKFRVSFSKKQWFVEAICDKLERDEKKVKKLLEDRLGTSSNFN